MTGRVIDVLALPFGKYDDRVVGFAREAGYRSLLSLEERPAESHLAAGPQSRLVSSRLCPRRARAHLAAGLARRADGVAVLPRYIGENIGAQAIDETLTTSVRFRSLRHGLRAWRWAPQ
jgi:hypothetical protein